MIKIRTDDTFLAPLELDALDEKVQGLLSEFDSKRDPRAVFDAWRQLRHAGVHLTETIYRYMDRAVVEAIGAVVSDSTMQERSRLGEFLSAWEAVFQRRGLTSAAALRASMEGRDEQARRLSNAIQALHYGAPVNALRLGYLLRHYKGRVVRGRFIARCGELQHSAVWKVEEVKAV